LGGKFKAIVESEKYDTLTVNELFSKLKSVEVDRGMTAKIEGPTDSHSLTLIGGSKEKSNANPSIRMFSLSSLMSLPDEEFDMLGEDELALLHAVREDAREPGELKEEFKGVFQVRKAGHFFAECPKVNNHDKHKFKDKRKKSKKKDHGLGKKTRSQEKMKSRATSSPTPRTRLQARVMKMKRVTRRRIRRTSASISTAFV
jgi:hypothetical protein